VAGKEASFRVKVHDIQETVLPELDDEFAGRVARGVKTLNALKDRIEKNMKREREQSASTRLERDVIEKLIKISELEYPPIMVEIEAQRLLKESLQQLKASCKDEKEYEERLKQVPEAVLKEQAQALANKRALWALVIDGVAKAENIEVDDVEVDEEIEHIVSGLEGEKKAQREYLNDYQNRQNVSDLVKTRKTIEKLVEIVRAPKT
jgi:trigger factor